MTTAEARQPGTTNWGRWIKHGVIGGIVAGIIFPLFEMAWLMMVGQNPLMPLRMIGGIALGREALDPETSILFAGSVGMVVHMALSMMFGVVFALIVAVLPVLARSVAILVAAGAIYGTALWIMNFYLLASAFGWGWFLEADPVLQFIAHAGFYGIPLALYLWRFGPVGAQTDVHSTHAHPA